MENFFITMFGYAFVILATLLFLYLSMIIIFKMLGRARYYGEEIKAEYNRIKADRLYEANERKKIINQVMKESIIEEELNKTDISKS